ncbi:MAG: hypothetical protein RBT71_10775, partial [Flavobacteriales bacterium]|nr:hypothetical protein [Flavobacteriales bacterium]
MRNGFFHRGSACRRIEEHLPDDQDDVFDTVVKHPFMNDYIRLLVGSRFRAVPVLHRAGHNGRSEER